MSGLQLEAVEHPLEAHAARGLEQHDHAGREHRGQGRAQRLEPVEDARLDLGLAGPGGVVGGMRAGGPQLRGAHPGAGDAVEVRRAWAPASAAIGRGESAPANSGAPGGGAKPSEAFSRAIASSEPSPSRCALPALVMSAAPGSPSPASIAISPAWLVPSSTAAARCPGVRRSRVTGTPQWLLRLPSVLSTGPAVASTAATRSLVVVLPALPVIAISNPCHCSR